VEGLTRVNRHSKITWEKREAKSRKWGVCCPALEKGPVRSELETSSGERGRPGQKKRGEKASRRSETENRTNFPFKEKRRLR